MPLNYKGRFTRAEPLSSQYNLSYYQYNDSGNQLCYKRLAYIKQYQALKYLLQNTLWSLIMTINTYCFPHCTCF